MLMQREVIDGCMSIFILQEKRWCGVGEAGYAKQTDEL